jgi:hypothetical protein
MAVDSHANDFQRNLDRARSQAAVLLACIMLSGKTLSLALHSGRAHSAAYLITYSTADHVLILVTLMHSGCVEPDQASVWSAWSACILCILSICSVTNLLSEQSAVRADLLWCKSVLH